MEGVIGAIQMALNRRSAGNAEKSLIEEIEAVKGKLEAASARFEFLSDPDLVESCIYEMQALTARYRFLVREARSMGITKEAATSLKHTERF